MLLVAISLPIATKLVQQKQENRSSAITWGCSVNNCSACSSAGACGSNGCYWEAKLKVCTKQASVTKQCSGGNGRQMCSNGYLYTCANGAWSSPSGCGAGVPCASDGIVCGTKPKETPTESSGICGNVTYSCLIGNSSKESETEEYNVWECVNKGGFTGYCEQFKTVITDGFGPVDTSCGTRKYNCNDNGFAAETSETEEFYIWKCVEEETMRRIECKLPKQHILVTPTSPSSPTPTLAPDGACGVSAGTCAPGNVFWIEKNDIYLFYKWEFRGSKSKTLCVYAKNPTPTFGLTVEDDITPTPTPKFTVEEDVDMDRNGAINVIDFSQWKGFFLNNDPRADLDRNGSINSIDGNKIKIRMNM